MTTSFKHLIPAIALTSVFAISPVAPEAGNILFMASGAVALALIWPSGLQQLRHPIAWMPLFALLLIGMAYLLGAGLEGLGGLLYFSPVLAIWPLVSMAGQSKAVGRELVVGLAVAALCGVCAAAIMAVLEVLATGTDRAGAPIANPIHFADVTLLVGFVSLLGLAFVERHWRLLFALGPLAALVAVALSGTRGAVVAFVVMLAMLTLASTAVRLVRPRTLFLGAIVLGVSGLLASMVGLGQLSGFQRILADIVDIFLHGVPTDQSTALRLQMYIGGLRAFLESPVFGHGPFHFTAEADRLADMSFGGAPHLHNDLVDMAASAGVLGVAGYLLIVLAPVYEAVRAPSSSARPWTIAFVTTLVGGFIVMGLTNAMFGILNVTTTYAAICVLAGVLARTGTDIDRA